MSATVSPARAAPSQVVASNAAPTALTGAGPTSMGSSFFLGSADAEVQAILSAIPLVSFGLLTIALLTVWLANARWNRAILDIGLTGIALFLAGLLQMSEAILCEDRPAGSLHGVSVAAALFLALGNLNAFLLRRVEMPSVHERMIAPAPVVDEKPRASLVSPSSDPWSNAWSQLGRIGSTIRLALFGLVALIGILDAIWRIGFLFSIRRFVGVERASVALQMIVLAAVAAKVVATALMARERPRRPMTVAPLLFGIVLAFSVLITDAAMLDFTDTALGRVLNAFVLYVWLVDYAIRESRSPVRDSLSFPASERTLSGSFVGIDSMSRASTFRVTPPPAPPTPRRGSSGRSAELDRHVGPVIRRSSGRLPSWLSPHAPRQRVGSDAERLTDERGRSVEIAVDDPETAMASDAESDVGPDTTTQRATTFALSIPSYYGDRLSPFSSFAAERGVSVDGQLHPTSFLDATRSTPDLPTLPAPAMSAVLAKAGAAARPEAERKVTSRSSDSRSSGARTMADRLRAAEARDSATPSVVSEAASDFSLSHFPQPPEVDGMDGPRASGETVRLSRGSPPEGCVQIDGADFLLEPPRMAAGRESAMSDDSTSLPTDVGGGPRSLFASGPLPLLRSMPASPTLSDVDASILVAERRTPPQLRPSPLSRASSLAAPPRLPGIAEPPPTPPKDGPTPRIGLPSSPGHARRTPAIRAGAFQQSILRPPSAFKQPRAAPDQPPSGASSSSPAPRMPAVDKGKRPVRGRQIKLVIPDAPTR